MYSLTDTIAYIFFFTIPSVTKIPHRTCPLCKAPTVEEFDGTKCAQSIVHVSYKFYFLSEMCFYALNTSDGLMSANP